MTFSLADKLYADSPYTDIIEVLGRKFTFRSLGQSEELEIARFTQANTFVDYSEARKVPTLSRAIVKIDGHPMKDAVEVQQLLRSNSGMTEVQAIERVILTNPAYTSQVIDAIYVAYAGFRARYFVHLEALKKNSTPAKAEPSGSSVKA